VVKVFNIRDDVTLRYNAYDFLCIFPCSRYSELFVESSTFFYLTRASQVLTPLEFRQDVWHQKTRVSKLLCSIISRSCVYPFSRFRQNTDLWQTDRL